jgi:hypothetical protein
LIGGLISGLVSGLLLGLGLTNRRLWLLGCLASQVLRFRLGNRLDNGLFDLRNRLGKGF